MNEKDRRGLRAGLLAAVTVFGLGLAATPVFSEDVEPAAAADGVGGMTIHVDPKTGAILKESAPGSVPLQLSPQLRNALSTSHRGLVETLSAKPGGGVKIDLQGRFQSPLVVTIDADGEMKLQHLEETPGLAGEE